MKKKPSDKIGRVYPPLEGEGKLCLNGGRVMRETREAEEWEKNGLALRKGTLAIRVMVEETHSEINDSTTETERDLLTAQT